MENDDESVKTENMGAEGSIQGKKHGFSSHSSGTWNQDDMISSAEKDSVQLPPKTSTTEEKA